MRIEGVQSGQGRVVVTLVDVAVEELADLRQIGRQPVVVASKKDRDHDREVMRAGCELMSAVEELIAREGRERAGYRILNAKVRFAAAVDTIAKDLLSMADRLPPPPPVPVFVPAGEAPQTEKLVRLRNHTMDVLDLAKDWAETTDPEERVEIVDKATFALCAIAALVPRST